MTSTARASESVVSNGGFELWSGGQAPGWEATTHGAAYEASTLAHSGAYCARVTPQAVYGGLKQAALPVQSNATYKLTCWLRGGDTGTDDTVRLLIVDWTVPAAPIFTQSDTTAQGGLSPGQWKPYELEFETGAQTTQIDIELGAYQFPDQNPIVFLADDVRVEWVSGGDPVPSPTPTPLPQCTAEMIAHGLVGKRAQPTGADRNQDARVDVADVVFAVTQTTTDAAQLTGGDFETWNGEQPQGWEATDAVCVLNVSGQAQAGSSAALVQPEEIYGGVIQRGVAVQPWTHYRFTAWLRATEGSPDLNLRLLAEDHDPTGPRFTFNEVDTREGLSATQWSEFSLEFWTGPSTSWVDLEVSAAQYPDVRPAGFLIDSASLTKIETWAQAREALSGFIDAMNHGAYPSDGLDDTAALTAAIEQLATTPCLVLAPGRYGLSADHAAAGASLTFSGQGGIEIQGYGAALIGEGLTRPVVMQQCAGVQISGLSVDWDRPPYSVGQVQSATAQSFVIRIFDEFPVDGTEPVAAIWEFDQQTGRPPWNCLSLYDQVASVQSIGSQLLQINLTQTATVTPGRILNLRHQVYAYDAFKFDECSDVTLRDINILSTPGMAVLAEDCDNVTISGLHARIRPHTKRFMSVTADGIHCMNCAGDVIIEDSSFEGTGDDAVNVHGMYLIVDQILSSRSVLTHHARGYANLPRPGDRIEMSLATQLLPYASATVSSVRINISPPYHGLSFTEDLPAELAVGDILGNATRAPSTRLRRNRVLTNRGRGFLASTRDVVIEDNLFEYCTGGSLLISTDVVSFHESIGVRQMSIRDNRSFHCNYGTGACEGDIQLTCYLGDWSQGPAGVHRDVTIEGNRIEQTYNSAIFLGATAQAQVLSNTITGCCLRPTRGEGYAGIYLKNTGQVRLESNTLSEAGAAMTQALRQENATQTTLIGNSGF